MYVTRRQEAMIREATLNRGSFHPLLFSCIWRKNGFLMGVDKTWAWAHGPGPRFCLHPFLIAKQR